MLAAACVLGAALAPAVALVGLPLAGAGAAALAYRGRTWLAAIAVAVGAAAAVAIDARNAVYVVPALTAVLAAVALVPSRPFQPIALVVVLAITGAAFALDQSYATELGKTVPSAWAEQMRLVVEQLTQMEPAMEAAAVARLQSIGALLAMLWPAAYFQVSLVVAAAVFAAISWAARRSGREVGIPALAEFDLSVHALWVPLAGLAALVAAGFADETQWLLGLGANLVMVSRALFLLQGLAVTSYGLRRAAVRPVPRAMTYVMLLGLDAMFFLVSIVGLIDVWANLRRLPRDGGSVHAPTDDPQPERRW